MIARSEVLLTKPASQVLESIIACMQAYSLSINDLQVLPTATGSDIALQTHVFHCLKNWLVTGDIKLSSLQNTPLFQAVFEAIQFEPLFEVSADILCEIIACSGGSDPNKLAENRQVIETMYFFFIS